MLVPRIVPARRFENAMNKAHIKFTKFNAPGVAKSYELGDGCLVRKPAKNFSVGTFETVSVDSIGSLLAFLKKLCPGDFLTAGVHQSLPSGRCGLGSNDIHRTKENFPFISGQPGLLIIDGDNLDKLGLSDINSFANALEAVVGSTAEYVLSPSASSGISYDAIVGLPKGIHAMLFVVDAAAIPATLNALHKRAVLLGYAWPMITKDGKILIRSLVDTAMKTSNQPCYEGGAICGDGITQTRDVLSSESGLELAYVKAQPLSPSEEEEFLHTVQRLTNSVADEASQVRARWRSSRLEGMVSSGCSAENANKILDAALLGTYPILYSDFKILTDNYGILTIREILADRIKYHEATCRDPLDWEYGSGKAKIYSNNSGRPAIHSFAHGETSYILEEELIGNQPPKFTSHGGALDFVDRTDAGNVAVLANLTKGNLRFILEDKIWLVWVDNRWRKDHGGKYTHQLVLGVAEYYIDLAKTIRVATQQPHLSDSEKKKIEASAKSLENWATQCRNKNRIDSMLGLAQRDKRFLLEAKELDQNKWLMGVANGVVNLQTGLLKSQSRDDYVTKYSPIAFNPTAISARWDRFVAEITSKPDGLLDGKVKMKPRPHLASYLQTALGYSASASTEEQVMFIANGDGSNGKNVLLDTTKFVLGDYAETIAPEVLMAAKFDTNAEQASPSIRKLAGARVAFSSESKKDQKLDVSVVKRHTGGGFITARGLHENSRTFEITHKLWLMTNHAPQLDHLDEATKGRLHLIPFVMRWNRPGETNPNASLPDGQKDLMEVLEKEREGILLWLVRGAVKYKKSGLKPPAEVVAFTQSYLDSQDMLKIWLQEYETCPAASGETAGILFDQYRTFCREEGEKDQIASSSLLGKKLTGMGYQSLKTRNGKKYGLKKKVLTSDSEASELRSTLEEWFQDDPQANATPKQCVTV